MDTIAFQAGQKFKVRNKIEEDVYIFEKIVFVNGLGEVHCIDAQGNEIILEETYLSDLKHI